MAWKSFFEGFTHQNFHGLPIFEILLHSNQAMKYKVWETDRKSKTRSSKNLTLVLRVPNIPGRHIYACGGSRNDPGNDASLNFPLAARKMTSPLRINSAHRCCNVLSQCSSTRVKIDYQCLARIATYGILNRKITRTRKYRLRPYTSRMSLLQWIYTWLYFRIKIVAEDLVVIKW